MWKLSNFKSKNDLDLSNKVLKNKIIHLRNSKITWIAINFMDKK